MGQQTSSRNLRKGYLKDYLKDYFKKSTKTRKDYLKDYATKERILKSFKIGEFQEIETLNFGDFVSVDLTLLIHV